MSKDQGRRLQLAREHAGYKSGRMAAMRLGWKYPTYAAHESGIRTYPPKVASKYARAFNVHPDFLIYGTRPPEWWSEGHLHLVEVVMPVRYMSLFHAETAEDIERQSSADAPTRKDYCIADTEELPPSCIAYRVHSDEMPEAAPRGSVLIIDREPSDIAPGALVLLHVRRQLAPSLRRVKSMPGGRLRYVAQNENYEPLEDSDARIIGRAVLHVRAV